jgi:hypothetical protein
MGRKDAPHWSPSVPLLDMSALGSVVVTLHLLLPVDLFLLAGIVGEVVYFWRTRKAVR